MINTIENKIHLSYYDSIEHEIEHGWSHTDIRIRLMRPLFIIMLLNSKKHVNITQYNEFINQFELFDGYLWK